MVHFRDHFHTITPHPFPSYESKRFRRFQDFLCMWNYYYQQLIGVFEPSRMKNASGDIFDFRIVNYIFSHINVVESIKIPTEW